MRDWYNDGNLVGRAITWPGIAGAAQLLLPILAAGLKHLTLPYVTTRIKLCMASKASTQISKQFRQRRFLKFNNITSKRVRFKDHSAETIKLYRQENICHCPFKMGQQIASVAFSVPYCRPTLF